MANTTDYEVPDPTSSSVMAGKFLSASPHPFLWCLMAICSHWGCHLLLVVDTCQRPGLCSRFCQNSRSFHRLTMSFNPPCSHWLCLQSNLHQLRHPWLGWVQRGRLERRRWWHSFSPVPHLRVPLYCCNTCQCCSCHSHHFHSHHHDSCQVSFHCRGSFHGCHPFQFHFCHNYSHCISFHGICCYTCCRCSPHFSRFGWAYHSDAYFQHRSHRRLYRHRIQCTLCTHCHPSSHSRPGLCAPSTEHSFQCCIASPAPSSHSLQLSHSWEHWYWPILCDHSWQKHRNLQWMVRLLSKFLLSTANDMIQGDCLTPCYWG